MNCFQKTKYIVHIKLGPKTIPTQKIQFPRTCLSFNHFVLLNCTNDNWFICNTNKYPLTFLKITHIASS